MLPRDDDDPNPRKKIRPRAAKNLAETAARSIADNRTTHTPRSNESNSRGSLSTVSRLLRTPPNAENHQLTMDGNAMALEVLKLRRTR
jgi:hypothetical protein